MSLLGDAAVPTMLWLAFSHPVWFFVALAVALVLMVSVTLMLFKFLRALLRTLRARVGAPTARQRPEATNAQSMFHRILIANRGDNGREAAVAAKAHGGAAAVMPKSKCLSREATGDRAAGA